MCLSQHVWDVFFLEGPKILFRYTMNPSFTTINPNYHIAISTATMRAQCSVLPLTCHLPPYRIALSIVKLKERAILQMKTCAIPDHLRFLL